MTGIYVIYEYHIVCATLWKTCNFLKLCTTVHCVQSAFSCLVNALWRRRKVLTHNEALPPHFSYLGIINSSLNLLIYLSYLDCLLGEDVGCIVAVVLPGHAHVSPEVIAPPSLQQCMGSRHLDYNIPKDGLPSSGLSCITNHGLPSSGLSFDKVWAPIIWIIITKVWAPFIWIII